MLFVTDDDCLSVVALCGLYQYGDGIAVSDNGFEVDVQKRVGVLHE